MNFWKQLMPIFIRYEISQAIICKGSIFLVTLLSTGLPVDLFPYMALEQKAAAEWKIGGLTLGPLFKHCY